MTKPLTAPDGTPLSLYGLDDALGGFTARDIRRFQGGEVTATPTAMGIEKGTLGVFMDGVKMHDGWLASIKWVSGPSSGNRELVSRKEFVERLAFRLATLGR